MSATTAMMHLPSHPPDDVLDSVSDGILVLDQQWRIVYLNRAIERIIGNHRRRLLGKCIWQQFPQAVGSAFDLHCRRAMAEQIPIEFEDRYAFRDAWYAVRLRPSPSSLCIYIRDITDIKRAQEALWQSEQKLRLAQQVAKAGVWDIHLPTGYTLWSEELYGLFGMDPSNPASYETFLALVHEEDRDRYAQAMRQSIEHHTDSRVEFRIHHPQRGERWLLSIGRTFYDADNRPIRRSGVKLDITEQKRDEERLRESERHYRRLIETASEGIWVLDAHGYTTFANTKLEAILGYGPGEMLGKHLLEFVSEARRADARENLHRRHLGVIEQFEFRYLRKDGTEVWTTISTNPIFDRDGRYAGALGMVTDISDRKRAEEQMRQAKEAAEAANRAKDDFLTTVSHELRTPIGAVLIWAKLLQSRLQDNPNHDPTEREAIDMILRCATDQMRLTDELLDASRIAHDQDRINLRPVDLEAVVQMAIDTVQPHAQAKGIELKWSTAPASVLGDAVYLQQMVSHLLSNAIKFTTGTGQVRVTLSGSEHEAQLRVLDHGDGMDPAFLPHVFEQFRQADGSITRKQGGLGLGLYTVRNIVELHGGTIHAHSAGIGQGSEFTVKLPLLPAATDHPHSTPALDAPVEPLPSLAGVRFLVLDSDARARDAVAMMLEACDATGCTAESPAEAWTLLQKHKPHLLICDIPAACEEHRNLIARLRELEIMHAQTTRVIALTRQAEDCLKLAALAVDAFLSHPIEPHILITMVDRILHANLPLSDVSIMRE